MTYSKRDAQHGPCPKCGAQKWGVRTLVNQGGTTMYPYVCEACGFQTQHYAKKSVVEALGVEPQELQPRFPRHKCEVCGASGAENHHWAPFSLFGEEAHRWPTSSLCPSCHKRWHDVVTPQGKQR